MPMANNDLEPGTTHHGNLKRMAYFAAVVETGSFTAAAERLGITKAVVSQQVARLEREFRTTLLTRTTRRVTPTDAGRAFHARCALVLKEAHDAFDELGEGGTEPSGTLRLTAALDYGITTVVPAVTEFTRRYPQCRVDAILSDQSLDVMSGQVELAIRVGWLTDPAVQARQIGAFRQLLVAAPAWQDQVDALEDPQGVARLPFVANTALREPTRWSFSRGELERQGVSVHAVMSMDATLAVREAVRLGAGLSVLPDYVVAEDLAAGRLVHVLPQWALPSGGIHAVFPPARFRPAKVRAFVDLLQETGPMGAQAGRVAPGAVP
ncbi:LysR family transcriptional regulator [Paracidovorax avenae]|uniref:LysR family transcriptional regulator n=1 Tax=Paracidovorax avenae TaxID=80867 RepID=UPI0006B3A455